MFMTEDRITCIYSTRRLIAEAMVEMASMLNDPVTLDKKYDESYKGMYEHMAKALKEQVELERTLKR